MTVELIIQRVGGTVIIDGTLMEDPIVQQRMRTRSDRPKILYDPNANDKKRLRNLLQQEVHDLGESSPIFEDGRALVSRSNFFILNDNKDLDNLGKFILDVMQGPLYKNDKVVKRLILEKIVAEEPKTSLKVYNFKIKKLATVKSCTNKIKMLF